MRGGRLVIALVVLLGAGSALWAGPFTEIPSGHWTYEACSRLVALDIIQAPNGPAAFSGRPQLTRFEFGIALLEPLRNLDRQLALLPADADSSNRVEVSARTLGLSPQLSEDEIAQAAGDLRRLCLEFNDVLRTLGFDPTRVTSGLQVLSDSSAVRDWRANALSRPMQLPALAPVGPKDDTVRVPLAHGRVALTFQPDLRPPELLDYLALSAADSSLGESSNLARAEPSPRDPRVSRLRTAYEYGLSSALTLSLAYEEIARRGHGLSALDRAYLASLGVGYRVTPSASVNLSYSLLEYSNYVFDSPKVRDRVAETAVSIEF